MVDDYNIPGTESSFRRYINSIPTFCDYFKNKKHSINAPAPLRYETDKGKQAQLDWKESLNLVLKNGECVTVNIFVIILSYSRFRVYRLSLSKTQDILMSFITNAFETFGGVPETVLCDNMKTIMDSPRTSYNSGVVNNKFQQFADDFGFKVKPCIAGRPQTKAKVESPMRILDELKAYNDDLSYEDLHQKLQDINDRENRRFHSAYQSIPLIELDKEKDALLPLPGENLRRQYQIKIHSVIVNTS